MLRGLKFFIISPADGLAFLISAIIEIFCSEFRLLILSLKSIKFFMFFIS